MKPALLCIDMQYLVAARGCGIFADPENAPISEAEQTYYFSRLEQTVLPNVQKLQALFRDKGIEVIHLRTRSKTRDGRERTYWHKRLGLLAAPGTREADFLGAVAPRGDELIINKVGSGPFGNTNIHSLLSRLDISQLYCCGVHTHEFVESTIRAAADHGYSPILIEDATASTSHQMQQDCVERLNGRYCEVTDTAAVVEDFEQHVRSVL